MSGDVQEIGNRHMKKVNKEKRPVRFQEDGALQLPAAARRISVFGPEWSCSVKRKIEYALLPE